MFSAPRINGKIHHISSLYKVFLERDDHLSEMQMIVLNIELEMEVVTCLNHILCFVTAITVSTY